MLLSESTIQVMDMFAEVKAFRLAVRFQAAIGRARKLGLPPSFLVIPTQPSRTISLAFRGEMALGLAGRSFPARDVPRQERPS